MKDPTRLSRDELARVSAETLGPNALTSKQIVQMADALSEAAKADKAELRRAVADEIDGLSQAINGVLAETTARLAALAYAYRAGSR
jgi:hypothetical protein